jgi:hypothetical protein
MSDLGFTKESTPGEGVREFYRKQGVLLAVKRIKDHICFDALQDLNHRCSHHGGKCYELWNLIESLKDENTGQSKSVARRLEIESKGEAQTERERIIKAVTNASTQIADLYWYRDAGRPEEAFEFLLSVIKGENK